MEKKRAGYYDPEHEDHWNVDGVCAVMMFVAVYVYHPSPLPLLKQCASIPVPYPQSGPTSAPSCDR